MAKRVAKDAIVDCISGSDRGRSGKVLEVYPRTQRALVEGLNLRTKHIRKTQDNPQGGIVTKEAPIHISNLRVQD